MEAGGAEDICSICGRTMLKGEQTDEYVEADGGSARVCVLCRPSAERMGWLRSELAAEGIGVQRGDRRRSRGGLPWRRRGRRGGEPPDSETPARARAATPRQEKAGPSAGNADSPARPDDAGASSDGDEGEGSSRTERPPEVAGGDALAGRSAARSAKDAFSRLAAPGRRVPRPVRAVPSSPEARFELALELFNSSDNVRAVASISRSLGEPRVSVGSLSGSSGDVRLTVAWDLSWYQWAVDLTDPDEPVRALAKGSDVEDLDQPARQWNAHADGQGRLHRGAASAAGEG